MNNSDERDYAEENANRHIACGEIGWHVCGDSAAVELSEYQGQYVMLSAGPAVGSYMALRDSTAQMWQLGAITEGDSGIESISIETVRNVRTGGILFRDLSDVRETIETLEAERFRQRGIEIAQRDSELSASR